MPPQAMAYPCVSLTSTVSFAWLCRGSRQRACPSKDGGCKEVLCRPRCGLHLLPNVRDIPDLRKSRGFAMGAMALFCRLLYFSGGFLFLKDCYRLQGLSYKTRQVHTHSCRRAATRTSVSLAQASGASWWTVLDPLLQLLTC